MGRGPFQPDQIEQVLEKLLKDRGIELIANHRAFALGQDEARGAKDSQMARDGGPREREAGREVAGATRSVAERLEDRAPGWIGERAEDGVGSGHAFYLAKWLNRSN